MRFAAALSAIIVVLAATCIEAQQEVPAEYSDKLFGITAKTAGFSRVDPINHFSLLRAWSSRGRETGSVDLAFHRNTELEKLAGIFELAATARGLKETSRGNGRIGSLRGTLIEYGGDEGDQQKRAWALIAEVRGDFWSLLGQTGAGPEQLHTNTKKLFDNMARSFRNTITRINPRRLPDDSVLICERFGFSIDTAGSVGQPEVRGDHATFGMEMKDGDRTVGFILVQWAGRMDLGDREIDELIAPLRMHLSAQGHLIRNAEKSRFNGKDSLRAEWKTQRGEDEVEYVAQLVPGGTELFQAMAGWTEDVDQATRKRILVAFESIKLSNPGKSARWPGQKR